MNASFNAKIKILDRRLGTEFPLPSYATAGSAGIDIRAMLDKPITINPGDTVLTHSGFCVFIEDPLIVGIVYPRSGLGYKHGIVLANLVGVIDSDYQGQLMVPLWNRSHTPFTLNPGDRIAQLVFERTLHARLNIVEDFAVNSERGLNGFGSTGIR